MAGQFLRDLTARLKWRVDDAALDKSDRKLDKHTRKIDDSQRRIERVGKAVAAGLASAGVVRELERAADSSIAFARTLADLQSLLPGQTARVEELGAGIRKLAVEYGADAEVLSKATYQIISAVGDGADTLDRLALAQRVAIGANTDAATAFDLLSSVTLAYGDASIEAQRKVADLAFTAVQFGKTTLPEVTASVGRAAPAFAALGVSQAELFGLTGALSGVSGSTAEVMTQLSAVVAGLTNRSKDMDKAFRKLGVKTAKELIDKRGLVGALTALRGTTNGTAEALTKLLGREEAVRGALAITGASAGRVSDSLAAVGRSSGAASKAFVAAQTGAGAAAKEVDRLNARAEELQRQIGDRVAGPLAEAKVAALGLAEAIGGDLFNAMDIFAAESNEFAQSDGFKALGILRSLASGVAAAGDVVGTTAGVLGRGLVSSAAGFATGVAGDEAGSLAIKRLADAENDAALRGLGARLSTRGAIISGALGDTKAATQISARAELASVGLAARRERDRALAERGIDRSPAQIAARRQRNITASVGTINIALGGNATPDQIQGAVRRGVGEGLGDALGNEIPDPTAVP